MGSNNVVLVTIDSLRRDSCGFMGYDRETTPFLDTLAPEAFVAENCYANGTASAQAFRSILSSTYPLEHDDYDQLSTDRPYLPELLDQTDVKTFAFVAENPYVSQYFGFDRGFDQFEDFMGGEENSTDTDERSVKETVKQRAPGLFDLIKRVYFSPAAQASMHTVGGWEPPYNTAREVVDEALGTVEPEDDPMFLWVHFMDVHSPHLPFEEYDEEFVPGGTIETFLTSLYAERDDLTALQDCYDASIRYVDRQIERLTSELESMLDDFHLFVTNDHGELFGEHDTIGHPHEHIYPDQIAAPLLVRSPDTAAMRQNETTLTTHLDLLPTILDIYDVSIPDTLRGDSLFEDLSREHVIAETCPYDQEEFSLQYDQHKVAVMTDEAFYVDTYDEDADPLPNFPGSRAHVYDERSSRPTEQIESLIDDHRDAVHYTTTMDDIFSRVKASE